MAAIPPYGVTIHQAIATGDLARMRMMVPKVEEYLRVTPDVRGFGKDERDEADSAPDVVAGALEELKAEIAKLEGGR